MSHPIEVRDLTVRYGAVLALDGISSSIPGGTICGLLGRNGAGKSTLLATIAAFRRADEGTVRVDGDDPYEDERLMGEICLVRERGDFEDSIRVREALELASAFRPSWDEDLAGRLLDRFEVPTGAKVGSLSRGRRAALAISAGLATQAPVSLFDEPHLGMDVPSRYAFYEELLADYLRHPRTVVLSTHLIDEVASLLEDVVILDEGRVLLQGTVDDLRAQGTELTGPDDVVGRLSQDRTVLADRRLGPTRAVTVLERLEGDDRRAALDAGVELGHLDLQDLFVHLTTRRDDP